MERIFSPITHTFQVQQEANTGRLDHFISDKLPEYSRSFVQKLISQHQVTVNGKQVKSSCSLKKGDLIALTIPNQEPLYAQDFLPEERQLLADLKVNVMHEDKHFFILEKPAGLLVHRTSPNKKAMTLIDWLMHNDQKLSEVGSPERPGIVHRLDKDTSGIIIIARTNYAHQYFTKLFKERSIQKTYLAVVHGHPDKEGLIDLPVGRNPHIRNQMTVNGIQARSAQTKYKVITYFENAALVEVTILTGRTHQIRVHFKTLGHPLLGDGTYGKESAHIKRQALHAAQLNFTFDGTAYSFKSALPEDIDHLLKKLPLLEEK
ncbi:MAG: RluA family pseudouridine synthase [Candidatus Babeliales bacterium]